MTKQKTLKGEISLSGTGLHSGVNGSVRIAPAPADAGIVFFRSDIPNSPAIKADIAAVMFGDLFRRSTIGHDKIKINTIEHFLASCRAFDIDNVFVYIDCEEFPFFDGSALEIAKKIKETGVADLGEEKKYFTLTKPVAYKSGDIEISGVPSDNLVVSMWVEYKNPYVGAQSYSVEITPETFLNEIAPARTFGFVEEIEPLRKMGLIKGGSLDNALVFGDKGLVNDTKLRYENEIVRHKILDFLGDLALLGIPYKGNYTAVKSGHKSHIDFVKLLLESK